MAPHTTPHTTPHIAPHNKANVQQCNVSNIWPSILPFILRYALRVHSPEYGAHIKAGQSAINIRRYNAI